MNTTLFGLVAAALILSAAATRCQAQGARWERDIRFNARGPVTAILPFEDGRMMVATATDGIYLSSSFGGEWETRSDSLGSPQVYALVRTTGGTLIAGTRKGGIYRSFDTGDVWVESSSGMAARDVEDLAIGRDGTIYAATELGLYASTNDGDTWRAIGPAVHIRDIALQNDGTLYAGTAGSGTYYTRDVGTTWSTLPASSREMQVQVLREDPRGTVWVGASQADRVAVERTGLRALPVEAGTAAALAWTPRGDMLIGTAAGVYRAVDDGNAVEEYNEGLERNSVSVLATDDLGFVYAGTAGGRLYRIATSTSAVTLAEVSAMERSAFRGVVPNPAAGQASIIFKATGGPVRITLYDEVGRQNDVLIDQDFLPGMQELAFDTAPYPPGMYFLRLEQNGVSEARQFAIAR